MDYNRISTEDIDTYRLRLCKNKDLYDLSWQDIAELMFAETGEKKSPDVYRKSWRYFNEGYETAIRDNPTTSDAIDELEEKKLAIQKERYKLQAVKSEWNKIHRQESRSELFEEEFLRILSSRKLPNIPKYKIEVPKVKFDSLLPIADIHYGKKVIVRGFDDEIMNEYNVDIFEKRMWSLLNQIIIKLEKDNSKHVNLVNLSDSVDGILRMSQLQALELGVIDSVIGFSDFMTMWLNELSSYVSVDYYSCQGNHNEIRPLGSSKGDFAHENTERWITWHLQRMLKNNPNIRIHNNKTHCYFNVVGVDILATHGQDERNLESSIKDYIVTYNKPIDMLLTGHLHNSHGKTVGMNGLKNIEFLQQPSICGIDDYSAKLKKTANAGANLYVVEEGYGKTATYDIKLK
jgi:predicted phosphodiesterase